MLLGRSNQCETYNDERKCSIHCLYNNALNKFNADKENDGGVDGWDEENEGYTVLLNVFRNDGSLLIE